MVETIWFLGDVHGKFRHILRQIEVTPTDQRPKAVVFLGDIEAPRPFEEELQPILDCGIEAWWITGNHDTDSARSWQHLQGAMDRCIDGRVVDIAGIRIAGLGGIFRDDVWMPDGTGVPPAHSSYESYAGFLRDQFRLRYRPSARGSATDCDPHDQQLDPITESKLLKHRSTIFPDDYYQLASLSADILVTHEAPGCHDQGFGDIDDLAQAMGAKLVVHGHHHEDIAYADATHRLGFRVIGVGKRGITDINGGIVIPGNSV